MTQRSIDRVKGEGRRILVIDDDLAIRVLLQAVLARMGFEVDCAEDGLKALERVRENEYSLVLLDLMMPRMNGYEFLEQFGKDRPSESSRHIVVFTAAGPRGIAKLDPSSTCAALLKPFDLDEFLSIIERCLTHTCNSSEAQSQAN